MTEPRPRIIISSVMDNCATLGEIMKRIEECLDDRAKGEEPGKVWIVLEPGRL